MKEFLDYFKNKKNLINLLVLGILILAIPLGVNLRQQIIKSRAVEDPIKFTGDNVRQKTDGTWVTKSSQISLELTSSFGPVGTAMPAPTTAPTSVPTTAPTSAPTTAPTSVPTTAPTQGPNLLRSSMQSKSVTATVIRSVDSATGEAGIETWITGSDNPAEKARYKLTADVNGNGRLAAHIYQSNPNKYLDQVEKDKWFDIVDNQYIALILDAKSSTSPVTISNVKLWKVEGTSQQFGNKDTSVSGTYSLSGNISGDGVLSVDVYPRSGGGYLRGYDSPAQFTISDNEYFFVIERSYSGIANFSNVKLVKQGSQTVQSGNLLIGFLSLLPKGLVKTAFAVDCGPSCDGGGVASCKGNAGAKSEKPGWTWTGKPGICKEVCNSNTNTHVCSEAGGGGTVTCSTSGKTVTGACEGSNPACALPAASTLSDACAACIAPKRREPGTDDIADLVKGGYNCSAKQLITEWCSNISTEATNSCNSIKATCSACASLPKPTGLKVTCSGNQATFSWGSVTGAGSYLLRFSKQGNNWKDVIHGDAGKTVTGASFNWSTTDCIAEKDASGNNVNVCFSPTARYNLTIQPFATGEQYPSTNPQSDGLSFNCSESTPSAPPSAPPSASPSATVAYRIGENPTDLAAAVWQTYTVHPMPVNYEFKNKTPGAKFIYVQFKDSAGNVTTTTSCPKCTASIKLLGPDPVITSCALSFEGTSTVLNLKGQNFGSVKAILKSNDKDLEIKEWKDGSIKAVRPTAPDEEKVPVILTNPDGQSSEEVQCSAVSQLALGAKVFCRTSSNNDTDNVDLVLVGDFAGGKKLKQKVKIDKDGFVQTLTQKLESGQKYIVSLKAPKSLRRIAPFTAENGVTTIPNFILPVGDIFPADGGDGSINALDKAELNRQWIISADATGRSGDFNRDGRVNSIDWACMRYDFGKSDDLEPVVPITAQTQSLGVGTTSRQ